VSGGPVIVTGATGFVGSHVVEQAVMLGLDVIATGRDADRFSALPFVRDVRFIASDLHDDPASISAIAEEASALIHLAWPDLPDYRNSRHVSQHLDADVRLLKILFDAGLRRLVGVGTCLEYGLREGQLDEAMPTDPQLAYPQAKDALRNQIETSLAGRDASFAWARLFYMHGPRQNPRSLLAQLDAAIERGDEEFAMSGGQQLRDYLPVEKVARRLLALARTNTASGIFNICSGVPVSIEDLVSAHIQKHGSTIRPKLGVYDYPDYEPMAFWGSTEKFSAEVGAAISAQ
jgi:nucleoside-diphosphate-sugar epimerase